MKIKNIHIKAFRGIVNCDLPLKNRSLLLVGENGTGKSSVVDAIEFFFTKKTSSLTGTAGVTVKRHGPHANYDINDVEVELTFNDNQKPLRTYNDEPSYQPNLKKYFNIADNGSCFLHRRDLLGFIDGSPSERFDAVGNLIGIKDLTKKEDQLRKAHNYFLNEVEKGEKQVQDIVLDISNIIGSPIDKFEDILLVINDLLAKNNLPEIESFDKLSEHNEEMYKYLKKSNKLDKSKTLQEILDILERIYLNEKFVKKIQDLNDNISKQLKLNINETIALKKLLDNGKIVLDNNKELKNCPLCKNTILRESLLSEIEKRSLKLEKISTTYELLKKESFELAKDIGINLTDLKNLVSKISSFDECKRERINIDEMLIYFIKYKQELESSKDLKFDSSVNNFANQVYKLNNVIEDIKKKCNVQIAELNLNEDEVKFLKFVKIITKATEKIQDLEKVHSNLEQAKAYSSIATKIYTKFSEIKSNKIQDIFDSIQADMQKYYLSLHNDDPHKNIVLTIKEGRNNSAEIKIDSFGREGVHPKAYTSEGHLDSLGLCIFLAFIKKFNSECSLIVLDDIVTTVDSAHRELVCKLLFNEFKDKQFIITTHDRLWYRQLVESQQAFGIKNDFLNCTIDNWDLKNGPEINPYIFRWDKIQKTIDSGDGSCAGNEGRKYLEWVLKQVCEATSTKIPLRKDNKLTVGDMIDPAQAKLRKIILDEETNNEIMDSFTEIRSSIIGNQLSHDDEISDNISKREIQRFCDNVKQLHDLVSCPTCNRFLWYHDRVGVLQCSKTCKTPKIIKTK